MAAPKSWHRLSDPDKKGPERASSSIVPEKVVLKIVFQDKFPSSHLDADCCSLPRYDCGKRKNRKKEHKQSENSSLTFPLPGTRSVQGTLEDQIPAQPARTWLLIAQEVVPPGEAFVSDCRLLNSQHPLLCPKTHPGDFVMNKGCT